MRGLLPGLVTCVFAVAMAVADGADDVARLDGEAKTFLTQFIKDRDPPIETCMIEPKWSDYGIPYEVAHAFLGLAIHADLQNIDGTQKPSQLLVAAGVPKEAICDEPARDRHTKARIDAWQAAFNALPPGGKPARKGFYAYRCGYSFPAFDRDFKRAVVVEVCSSYSNFFDDKGARKRGRISGGASAETYRRDAQGWHKVETIEMANWD